MSMHTDAVQRCLAAWNAAPDDVEKAVAMTFTDAATYTDPLADIRGQDAITDTIRGVREQFPGFEFRAVGTPDAHHHIARFSWELVSREDGSAPVAGFDVITLAEDGRVSSVSGFLDRVPDA
ncbi:nuclear transport factor 2 family protein [Frankia sp. AgB32]|uniref:nuclear transport factor 2 family protein n=1 Tax=Frankia sp. AgB32 TaxID=631119 RepID=UPI00200BFF6D|nr:nuclear transport factor 2 family protein [Frankia sp. AgB32]MCK9894165.1 nuclear transport factor 2 family protein [Frankia sp. AgB32]